MRAASELERVQSAAKNVNTAGVEGCVECGVGRSEKLIRGIL
jgi:hypothetical protein